MCGIFGFFTGQKTTLTASALEVILKNLFTLSQTRGREAAGLAIKAQGAIRIHKDSVSAEKMLKTPAYKNFIDKSLKGSDVAPSVSILGHTRLVTNGLQTISANNQPVCKNAMVLVHNGIITNEEDLWRNAPGLDRQTQVDTEIIPSLMHESLQQNQDITSALSKTFERIEGETSIGMFFNWLDLCVLATNTGSVYFVCIPHENIFFFVSEAYIAKQFLTLHPIASEKDIQQLKAGQALHLNTQDLSYEIYNINETPKNINIAPKLAIQNRIESRDLDLEQKRKQLKRCTKCLLPETMPFIHYDDRGVCNYCHNYRPQQLSTPEELEKKLSAHRGKNNTQADCLIAFSGGRDSSYGLHLLKKEYGMSPMAYTYDWGMVTPLARRNQARMCGQLGVEHIWVSADIKKKRSYIRMNVEAWMKKPHLGMIPLFMAGDKQFFYYANKIMEQTDIKLMIFCMNNLERTDFKYGFAGVPPKYHDHRSYSMSWLNQAKYITFFGKEFLTNPSYLNASLIDTFTGYISYYALQHDYVYLFNHIPWEEEKLNTVLLEDYNWEKAKDTPSTWRIGDGTAAFYNYIYYSVAGFTEFDTLRSNQIREGLITRDWALAQIENENKPRWESMREYMQLIQVDFDEAIRCIDSIPKLYERTEAL